MRGWWQDLTDLVLPTECGGCGRPRAVLCERCRAALSGSPPRPVRPDPEPPGLPVVHASAPYADEVRAALLAHKERGALALARPLGEALAGAVRAALRARRRQQAPQVAGRLAAGVLLVPVPSSGRAVRARGHDAGRRIALAAAGVLRRDGLPARVAPVLRQRPGVADQAGLTAAQRLANLTGALTVAPGGERLLLGAGPVVLVDDVMTTGASLAEAARAARTALYRAAQDVRKRSSNSAPAFVYRGGRRERRGEQPHRAAQERVSRRMVDEQVCAAVVAASPDAFELNRN